MAVSNGCLYRVSTVYYIISKFTILGGAHNPRTY